MKEKIENYYSESNSIASVVSKLINTQNVSIFEKLCIKIDDFLSKLEGENISLMLKSDSNKTKLCFYNLQRSIKVLEQYKNYLINSLSKENNKTLELVKHEGTN